MNCIIQAYKYLKRPRYVVMKGIQIENRAIMFLGARPIPPKDRKREIETHGYVDEGYQKLKISFENQKYTYWRSSRYKIIWTFKDLIRWRRMLPKDDSRCLEKVKGQWQKIKKTN